MLNIQSTIIAFVAALLIGVGVGAFFGLRHGDAQIAKLNTALVQVNDASKAIEKRHNEEMQELRDKTAEIEARSEQNLAKSQQVFEDYKINQAKLLAGKATEIANLQVLIKARSQNLKGLKSQLLSAKTDAEKATIQAKIAVEEKTLALSKARSAGLECLTTPVPEEYVTNLNNN